jgi:hypothetical protein
MLRIDQRFTTCCFTAEVWTASPSVFPILQCVDQVLSQVPRDPNAELPPLAALSKSPLVTGVDYHLGAAKRARPLYWMDQQSKGSELQPSACRKNPASLPAHTGGVFSFFCEHGICIG